MRLFRGFILLAECIMFKNSPIKKCKSFACKKCDFKTTKECNWDSHIATTKHRIRTNVQKVTAKPVKICLTCDYTCSKKSDLEKHFATAKHQKMILFKENASENDPDKILEVSKYKCINCDKVYNGRSSLWYHKKQCVSIEKPIEQQNYESCLSIIQKDSEFKTYLIEQNKQLMNYIMAQSGQNIATVLNPDTIL
jgi:hypothetical protein